jgi:hypothetical protein
MDNGMRIEVPTAARCITIEDCVVESSISTFANVFAARTFQNWRYRSLSNTSR